MSPEKLGWAVYQGNPKSDVYSLGLTMYEIISKRHPYLEHEQNTIDFDFTENRRLMINSLKSAQAQTLKSNDRSLEFNNLVTLILKMIDKSEPKRASFE